MCLRCVFVDKVLRTLDILSVEDNTLFVKSCE